MDEPKSKKARTRLNQFSLVELCGWILLLSLYWSTPHWMGDWALAFNCYSSLVIAMWRLMQFAPNWLALIGSILFAVSIFFGTITILEHL